MNDVTNGAGGRGFPAAMVVPEPGRGQQEEYAEGQAGGEPPANVESRLTGKSQNDSPSSATIIPRYDESSAFKVVLLER